MLIDLLFFTGGYLTGAASLGALLYAITEVHNDDYDDYEDYL